MPPNNNATHEETLNLDITLEKYNCDKSLVASRKKIITSMIQASTSYFDCKEEDLKTTWESNCFLLDGKWGSGKSWTLDVFKDRITNYSKTIDDKNIRYIKYSAWHYMDEKDLFVNLWDNVYSPDYFDPQIYIDAINLAPESVNNVKEVVKKANHAFGWLVKTKNLIGNTAEILEEQASKIITFYDQVSGMCSEIPIISDAVPILRHLKTLKSQQNTAISIDKLTKAITEKETKQNQIDTAAHENNIANTFMVSKPTIVVIDDLDRVHENKLWRILTLLSLFDNQPNLLFICSGSSDYLIKILEQKYHVKGEGENFLTKFFAREFQLEEVGYVDQLINQFLTPSTEVKDKIFVTEAEFLNTQNFLNSFVEISTYREYKTRYLQILNENKPQNVEEMAKMTLLLHLQLKYKQIFREAKTLANKKAHEYTRLYKLYTEIEPDADDKTKKLMQLILVLIGTNQDNGSQKSVPMNFTNLHNLTHSLDDISRINIIKSFF